MVDEKSVALGLGWDVTDGKAVDLDASCALLRFRQKKDHVGSFFSILLTTLISLCNEKGLF